MNIVINSSFVHTFPFLSSSSVFGVTAGVGDTTDSDLTEVTVVEDEVDRDEEVHVTEIVNETEVGGAGEPDSFLISVLMSSTFIGDDVGSCLILGSTFISVLILGFISVLMLGLSKADGDKGFGSLDTLAGPGDWE